MNKSVKSSAITHLLCCLPYRIFHIYYSSYIDSFPKMGQISALIFPKFWIKELEAEHHLKTPPSPQSLDVMEKFLIWVSVCVHKSWTFPSKLFVKYLMKFSLENKLLAYQTILGKDSILWLEINAVKSCTIKSSCSLINSSQSFPTWTVKACLWKQPLYTCSFFIWFPNLSNILLQSIYNLYIKVLNDKQNIIDEAGHVMDTSSLSVVSDIDLLVKG